MSLQTKSLPKPLDRNSLANLVANKTSELDLFIPCLSKVFSCKKSRVFTSFDDSIVNPFLDRVQSHSGLSAFRVVMDDSNNTPDVIDRNQLVGQIFIQPTRTAEFIVLDFVVQPTGATFPE